MEEICLACPSFIARSGQKVDLQWLKRGDFVGTPEARVGFAVGFVCERRGLGSTMLSAWPCWGRLCLALQSVPRRQQSELLPKPKHSLNFSLNRKASRFLDRRDSVATNLLLQFKKQTSV